MFRPLVPAMILLAYGPLDWKFPWWMWVLFWVLVVGFIAIQWKKQEEL